ncbi:MAG: exopolyphosphatase [Lewinellaceae bacterium]|nr:exopolyphosphatase [Lewinellaceae bacterium]
MNRVAVLDLGTNTFHLLVAEPAPGGDWITVVKHKIYVKLAEEGIQRIGDAAFERGLEALRVFKKELDLAAVPASRIKAFGTAALRTADNAPDFLQRATEIIGARPESIPGDREAELIHKGVRKAVPFPENRVLIMDIGGGSVEFIIADRERVFWQQSFPVGAAVLWRSFHQNDPITPEEVQQVENHLDTNLEPLWQALSRYPCPTLVGASGTFDVIDLFLLDPATKPALYGYIPASGFYPLYETLLRSTLAERRAMPKLPDERIEMVVVALVLIRFVLQKAGIREIYTSVYALKEGMLEEC